MAESAANLVTAPLWKRFVASLIDGVIYTPIVLSINLAVDGSLLPNRPSLSATILVLLAVALYDVGFLTRRGATPGKAAVRVQVVDQGGARIRFHQAAIRHFSAVFFYLGYLPGPLAFEVLIFLNILTIVIALRDPKRRALHDRVASTRVVKRPELATEDGRRHFE